MNIALCQINTIVGDFWYNADKILSFYKSAIELDADLVVFPEMTITGYPPQDLLLENRFVIRNLEALEKISYKVKDTPMIVGYVRKENHNLFNSAAVLFNRKMIAHYDKVLLPTYDVFDEDRYFSAGSKFTPVSIKIGGNDIQLGLQICEDLWDENYQYRVADKLCENGANLLINISASPFHVRKRFERMALVKSKAKRLKIPYLYCNLVGGQDELIFDGHSLAYDNRGFLIAEGRQFEEEIVMVDLNDGMGKEIAPYSIQRDEGLFRGLVLGVRDYFSKTGHKKCVIGLSGGIDSALTACIAVEALGKNNVLCISMPSKFTSGDSQNDAAELVKNLGVKLRTVPIKELHSEFESLFTKTFDGVDRDTTEENIQARIRGNILMAFSNKFGYLVLSTGNKTELALGYCTLYGDMSGGLAVISDLSKMDVYSVAQGYNDKRGGQIIPENIFSKPPSAELSEKQVDPFDYSKVSPLVDEIVENRLSKRELVNLGYDEQLVGHIFGLVRKAEFKRRQAAPGLKVTPKAFGMGRRYPIVNHFDGE